MGMELPAELRNLFSVLTGSEWPTADETRLWELAQVYGTTADQLEVELPQLVIRIKNKVRENFDATAADFFDQSVDEFTAGQNNYLGEGTKVARGLQEYVHNAGTQVQYAKWMIIGQLVQLALEIAWAIAMAPYTFGASLAKIPIFQAIARTVIGRVMFRLLSTLLQQMAISQFFALTLDALIQRIQIDQGNRDGWDHKLTEDAAKGAMLDGLFGTAAVFGGSALSGQFNKLLGNTTGPSITKHLDDNFPTGGPGGGPGGLPEGIGSVMGRNSDELLRPYGMDNRPGWNRPIDGERFRTDMGDQFANSLGGSMGKGQAREFGNAYADAFTRNWGRNGLDDALNDVVSKYGRGLDPNMRDFLTTGVPASVRDGLSDVGTHWKNFLAQLGGQGIANAAQGMLSEGFFNLLFSDEKSFSITWLSGVSGLVSGAVQQSLTQGGLLLIDHLRNAGLPEGVPPPTPTPSPTDDGLNDHRGGDGSPDGNENVSTSDSGSSSSNGPGSNNSSSEGAGGGSRDGRGDGSQNSTPPPPPPPQRVSTESSDTNDQDNTGSATPEPPSNENNGSNEGPATEDSPGRGSDRPVDNADENTGGDDSDHLNRGGQENSNSEGGGPGDAPVVGGQEQDTGGQDRSPEQTGDGEGAGAVDGPETPNGDQGGPENTPAEGSQNQETPAPTPNPPVQEQPVQETPAPNPAPPVQETPVQEMPVQESPTPTPNPPVQEQPVQETPAPNPAPPVQETPTPAPPVQETPVQEMPVQESPTPTPNPPVQETPAPTPAPPVQETPTPNPTPAPPVQETPVSETPVQETPNPPVQDASGDGEVGGGGPARENGGDTAPVRETPNQEQPAQDSPNPNPPVQERPVVDTSGDGVVRDTDGPVRENGAEDTPVQESPVQEQPAGDGVVREPGGSEDANGPEGTPVRETPEQNVPVQESPNQDAPVRETPNQEESNTGRPDPTTDDQGGRSTDQDTPAQGSQDATDGNGQTSTGPSPNAGGQGSSDGNANTHRPNGSGSDGGPETVTDHETGSDDTRTSQDGTGADVRPPGDRPSGESDSDATVHQNGDQQGRQNDDDSQGSTRDEDGSGAPVRQDDGSNESTARPDGTPVPVVMAPPLHPGAQGGQESTGDGRRQPPPGNQTNTPPVSRPRPDPDAPAPVSDRMRPPADWQNIRDSIEPTRVGGNRDRSGVDTDGVEILHGSSKDNPITSIADRGFDVRRIPLPDPGPDGPTHVTELTVRINFDTGPDVSQSDANTAQQVFLDRLNDVVNERYRLPGSGDQLHVRVEPVGPDGRPHSNVSWVRDNPDLPGRSDTANWRMDDGPDVWLHELLHRIGLNDESQDRSQDGSGRPRAVLRDSPNSSAVHEVGGYMDSPGGRDNRPPQILNHYLDQIETQANEASRYDPPARVGDLPDSVHRDLSQVLDPDGNRNHSDNVALFGAAYDSRVRGRGDDQVRADLPPRLREDFDQTVREWTSDGRWDQALDTARDAGMDAPLSQMPSGPTPVTTQGGDHRAASPLFNPFKSKSGGSSSNNGGGGRNSRNNGGSSRDDGGSGGRNRRRPESHPMRDLGEQRDREGDGSRRRRRTRVTDDGGEGSSRTPRGTNPTTTGETPPPQVQDGTVAPTDTQQQVDGETTRQDPPQIVVTPDLTPPDPPPVTRPVTQETAEVLDVLADIGPNADHGGYSGMRMNPDADVDGLRDRLFDQIRRQGVEPDGPALTDAIERISGGRTTPGETIDVPVHDPRRDGDGDDRNTPPPRGNVQLSVDRTWRDITDSPDRRVDAGNATENRAKTVGSGAQQSRKSVNPAFPAAVIGEIGGTAALITPRLKASFAVRQRGTEYQTSTERRHKRKVDVDGDNPARFTGDLVVNAVLDIAPPPQRPSPPPGEAASGDQRRPSVQQPPGQDTAGQQQPAVPPVRVEFSDRLNDAFDLVLPGHLRDNGGESAADHRPAPQEFRTDDPASRVDGGDGTPIRAPRFAQTLGLIDGTLPPDFPVSPRTLLDNLPRADNGEVLRFAYSDPKGRTQILEISGGPVNYVKVGPDLKDSSFTDTGKSSGNATFGAARTDKQEVRAGAGFLGGILPGESVVLRAGPEVVVGAKGTQKHTRSTEYGSERVFGPGAKGDSAFYQVERTYRVTTTEPQPAAPAAENTTNTDDTGASTEGNGGERGDRSSQPQPQPLVRPGTLDLTTLDQVSTDDARTLAGGGDNRAAATPPAAPSVPGLTADGVRHLGEAAPVRAEWNDGRLRDGNGDSPMTVAARRLHEQVFALHPELVNDPSGAPGARRGFWGSLWRGPDLRAENTLEIYDQVGRAVSGADALTTSGVDIVLRTGGLRNALTPAPGPLRDFVSAIPGLSSVRTDDRDGSDFLTVHLSGGLSAPRFEGSRSGGSLSSGLGASTAQGSGKQNSIAYGGEITAAFQARFGITAGGLPKGVLELGGGYTYEHETAKPFSGNRKGGVEASSKSEGDLDSWSYELRLDASIGSNTPVRLDVTPQGAGPDAGGPRVVLEGPRTTPVPGEVDRPGPNTDRSADARAARDAARQALADAQEARRAVDLAETERNRVQALANALVDRQEALTEAEKNLETAEKKAEGDQKDFQKKDEAATKAENQAGADRRQAVQDRLDAARIQQEAAERQADAVQQLWDYVSALREATGGPAREEGPGSGPDLTPLVVPAPGQTDQTTANDLLSTAVDNWNRTVDAKDEAVEAVREAEADHREASRPSADDGAATTTPPRSETPPAMREQRDDARDALRDAERLDGDASAQDTRADTAESKADESEKTANDLRGKADEARTRADESARRADEARDTVDTARDDRDASVNAVRDLPGREERLTQALDNERLRHGDAAAARGRGEDHRFALERDARLRPPNPTNNVPPAAPVQGNQGNTQTQGNQQNQGDQQAQNNQNNQQGNQNNQTQNNQQTQNNRGGGPRPRPDLDLDSLPHAPKHSESPGLLDNLVDSVRSAPGFTPASRSGEAVMGTWRVLGSPRTLAAHEMDVHDGGLPLQGQFEDGWRRRADLSLNVHAERESLHISGVQRDGGVDLTFKAESDRVVGTSESSSHNVTVGLKGEAALNQADSRYNRLRGAVGFTPFATKQTETQGDSTSFGEENKVSLPGSTVDVTTFDRFDVDTTIRTRWNLGVSLPFSKTVDGNGNVLRRGSAAEGLGDRNPPPQPQTQTQTQTQPQTQDHTQNQEGNDRNPEQDGQVQEEVTPAHHTANGQTDSRFRVLDLAQKGALPGTAGLDSALERSRSVPDDIRVVPGREGSGHALNNIDSAAALDSINRAVRDNRLELTDQSQRDIRAALSPNNTRGLNLRYQTGGLALEVRFRNEFMGEQRPSKGGWILLKLGPDGGPDGGPVFGPVESGMSSERSVSQSTEHNDSEGKQKKHGVTATLDGGVNPTQSIGTDSSGDPTFPKDRYQSFAPNTGTGLESGTTKTHLTSDTETESRSRTVKAPGATGNTPTRFDFTVSVEDGKVFSSHADVGSRTEVYPAGTFQPTPPGQPPAAAPPPVTSQPVPPPAPAPGTEPGTVDVRTISDAWFGGLGRPQVSLPPVEAVGRGPIADAAVIAQARALDWEPATGERNVTNAVDHLSQGRPGPRGPMLGAAVDQQVLTTLFGSSSTGDGATLVGLDKQGPFAVPGLETKLFTQVDPGGASIIGSVKDLSTGGENQNTHRDEDSVAHAGSTALTSGLDMSGIKGVDQSASGFDESAALVGGGASNAGAKSSAAGGGKQSTSAVQTHADAAVKGNGYLVRFPVDVLVVAQDTKSGTPPRAESTTSTVDVWLSLDQIRQIAPGVSAESVAAWDTVAVRQGAAADSEKALGTALDNELGLHRSEADRGHARQATDLLALGPELNPRSWSAETADSVQAIRDYLGSGAEDRGWNRTVEQTAERHGEALNGLRDLWNTAGTPQGLSEDTVRALSDLVERRDALHDALRTHRSALDSYFQALREAFHPTPPAPPPQPNTTGVNPLMQANFMNALNPTS